AYRWSLCRAITPRVFLIAFKYSQSFLIDTLLSLLAEDRTPLSMPKGHAMVAAYLLVYTGIAVAQGRYWHHTYRTITMFRGGLICAVSEKMLKLDATYTRIDVGFTLINTDVERMCQSLRNMHEVWANVIELGIAIHLLARQMGAAFVAPMVLAGT
ncbi:hypothetical protein EK21DRAFT_65006, partial [Setomelanomma holmii]